MVNAASARAFGNADSPGGLDESGDLAFAGLRFDQFCDAHRFQANLSSDPARILCAAREIAHRVLVAGRALQEQAESTQDALDGSSHSARVVRRDEAVVPGENGRMGGEVDLSRDRPAVLAIECGSHLPRDRRRRREWEPSVGVVASTADADWRSPHGRPCHPLSGPGAGRGGRRNTCPPAYRSG
jgi:hypothetical protein